MTMGDSDSEGTRQSSAQTAASLTEALTVPARMVVTDWLSLNPDQRLESLKEMIDHQV